MEQHEIRRAFRWRIWDHGVLGGENIVILDDGGVQYFSVRESARIQTFPDGYVFHGSWTETMRQLGNAVPVALARRVTAFMVERLAETEICKPSNRKSFCLVSEKPLPRSGRPSATSNRPDLSSGPPESAG